MNTNDFTAVAPVLMVTLAACTTMIAEAFRKQRDVAAARWFGLYGLIGLGGAIAACVSQWNQSLVGFGVIGWVDDWRKVVEKNSRGLPSRWKYFWQSVIGLAVAVYLWNNASLPAHTELIIPFFKHATLTLSAAAFIA